MAQIASFGGCLISWCFLITCSPAIANFALKFSTPEYFAVAVFGLTIIGSLSAHSPLKGFLAGLFGLIIADDGLDPLDGIPVLPLGAIISWGYFLCPGPHRAFWRGRGFRQCGTDRFVFHGHSKDPQCPTWTDMKKCLHLICGGGIIGTFIGALPGTGWILPPLSVTEKPNGGPNIRKNSGPASWKALPPRRLEITASAAGP